MHSVRMLSAYYASPTLAAMRAGLAATHHDGSTSAEPLLQPTFIHALSAQLDGLFTALHFDTQLGRHAPSGGAAGGGAGGAVGGPMADVAAGVTEGQRRILFGAFLALHGILPHNHVGGSSAAGAELLPFILATLVKRAGEGGAPGDTRGLHAAALRIAALGASESPWARR